MAGTFTTAFNMNAALQGNALSSAMSLQQSGTKGLNNLFFNQYSQYLGRLEGNCAECGLSGYHVHAFENKAEDKKEVKKVATLDEEVGLGMWAATRRWFQKHSDLIVTVVAVMLADHFFFNGKFRAKLESMVDGLIDRVTKKAEAA